MSTPAVDIQSLRLNRGLSLTEAAKQIGVSPNTLGAAESGESDPRPSSAFKIANFYGLQVTDVWPVAATGATA